MAEGTKVKKDRQRPYTESDDGIKRCTIRVDLRLTPDQHERLVQDWRDNYPDDWTFTDYMHMIGSSGIHSKLAVLDEQDLWEGRRTA